MKRAFALILALSLMLLCGCAAAPTETTPSTQPTQPSQTEPTVETDPTPTETEPEPTETEPEPTVPPVVYTNPLTGEVIDQLTTNRTYCVVFNNSRAAMPQHGVSQADILYETLIEGETRCMGVFYDITAATEPFGAIRSARRDFIRIAMGYDAIYVHGGRSDSADYGAKQYLEATGWDHIDGVHGPDAESYYYRTRGDQGYSLEHTLFIKPEKVVAYAEKMGCTTQRTDSIDLGLQFDEDAFIVGQSANKVTAWFNQGTTHNAQWHKYTTMNYNANTGLYEGYQYGSDYIDGNTGEVLSFRNVLILRTKIVTLDSELMKIDVTGSGTGYYACNGQMVPIKWSRSSESEPFTYTLENGTPITFGVGKTYVAIIPNNGHVDVQ